jgi:hypothetical protein
MKITSPSLILLLFLNSFLSQSQITSFKEKFELPEVVKETSGLLFFDGKIITHNDSGDDAYLYELDSLTGGVLRRITISNATHVDWEDITEDETYIYISDTGNNKGIRTDLKIYRILKSDFKNSNTVSAETILFSYEDQTNFISSNNHNFDAEALVIFENNFILFTKNRGDLKTNVYRIPTTIGNHTAVKISSANVAGLITGATVQNNNFLLCGIDTSAIPFLVYISSNRAPGDDIFKSGFQKYSLFKELGFGNQVEGITSFDNGRFYISREAVNQNNFSLKQKLFEFRDDSAILLSAVKNDFENLTISPNPTFGNITIQSNKEIQSISTYTILGEKLIVFNSHQKEINISHLSKGIYLLRIQFNNQEIIIKKIIKY